MNLFYSISLTVLGVLLLRRRLTRTSGVAVLAMVVLTLLLASSFWFIADLLTGRGIDESVIYHLKADLTGAGLGDFRGPIALSIVLVVFSFATALFTYRSARAHVKPARRLWRELAAVSSLLAAGYLNPTLGDIRIMATDEVASTATITQTASTSGKALTDIKFPARKRNLVVLYLESFERTYLDQTIFPGLAPHMVELEPQALSFSNIGQFYGDGWTIAGMVSSQCGVPLALPPAQGNAMSGMSHFLPGAICLGISCVLQAMNLISWVVRT